MFTRFARQIGALAILVATTFAPMTAAAQSGPVAPVEGGETTARTTQVDLGYRLGTGDKIRVIVFGEESLSGEFVVSGTGHVAMPLIGEVAAQGLTVSQFQTAVQNALAQGYLKEPRVSTEVLTYRPFYILGEVNRPGEYPYSSGLTVLNAIATAGGFTYRAQTKKVYIRHANAAEEESYRLGSETPVAPGDTIRVVERFF